MIGSLAARFPQLALLWSFVQPHRRTLALGLALGLVGTGTSLASPMVTKWVLDSLGSDQSLAGPVGALLVLLVVGTAITLWQWVLMGTLAERVVLDVRTSLVRRFFGATVPDVTRRTTGELVTRVTSDTVLLREAASSSIVSLVNAAIGLVGTLVLMAVLDLPLLGLTMLTIAVVGVLFGLLMPGIARAQTAAQEAVGALGGELEGSLRAIRTVKASRAVTRQGDRVVAQATESARHSIQAVRTAAVAWSISWSGVQLAIILILGFGAWRVGEGLLEVSSLIAFLLYAFQLMGPITELTQNVTALQSGIAAAVRIREVEDMTQEEEEEAPEHHGASQREATTEVADRRGAVSAVSAVSAIADAAVPTRERPARLVDDTVLELRGVAARYRADGPDVVDDIELRVPRRGHLAIVGPSGAGKTTLFSLILRFLEPSAGELLLDGRPYSAYTHDQVRARLGYVEQETPLVPGTIRDNLLFSHPDATATEIDRVLRAVRLEDKVAALPDGLDTSLTSSAVSGGQRQRLALARAILRMPEVLLLDEATAQVDGLTEVAIQECIRECAAQGAVVTIAHRLSTVVDADSIVVMQDGRVRAQGTHAELLASDELYRDLVEALRIGAELPSRALDPVG